MRCEQPKIKESHNIYSPLFVEDTTDLGNHYYEDGIAEDTSTILPNWSESRCSTALKVCDRVLSSRH